MPPKDGRPVILYRQGKTSGCLYCGLASALAFFGDNAKAKEIFNLQKQYDYKDSQWDHVIKQMEKCKTNQYVAVRYEDTMPNAVLKEYPHIEDAVLLVVLYGSDGSTNHSISICQGFIFDANLPYALKYSQKNLDWCCSAPGVNVKFVSFYKAVYFYPKKVFKHHRIPHLNYHLKME